MVAWGRYIAERMRHSTEAAWGVEKIGIYVGIDICFSGRIGILTGCDPLNRYVPVGTSLKLF